LFANQKNFAASNPAETIDLLARLMRPAKASAAQKALSR
jgi:hypothetical protein